MVVRFHLHFTGPFFSATARFSGVCMCAISFHYSFANTRKIYLRLDLHSVNARNLYNFTLFYTANFKLEYNVFIAERERGYYKGSQGLNWTGTLWADVGFCPLNWIWIWTDG